jgi:hypothetical protein
MRQLTIVAALALTTGCAFQLGTIERDVSEGTPWVAVAHEVGSVTPVADSTCKGLVILFGNAEGPCGFSGGTISLPAASAAVDIVKEAAAAVLTFFGKQPSEPPQINVTISSPEDDAP